MKDIKIKFLGFHAIIDKQYFLDILSKRYDVIESKTPDYVIYSVGDYDHLKYDCIRIFYTGECFTPDFNDCDYAVGFDRFSFDDRYARIPLYNLFQYKEDYQGLKKPRHFDIQNVRGRQFCTFVVSNCFAEDNRSVFFELLSKYKKVSSGGRYKNNIGGAVKDKKAFLSKHKFNIAFENSSYKGYCTEKIMEAFAAGTVPIYYGDPEAVKDFNRDAFINAHDYSSLEELVEKVKEVDNDDVLYLKMLNAPIISPSAQVGELDEFLYNIFEQELKNAQRRPHAQYTKVYENEKRRHVFFEKKIYRFYSKIRNLIIRLKTGTILTSKRTK